MPSSDTLLSSQSESAGDPPVDPAASEARPATTELPKVQVGPYRLIERLGTGGMGEVFRAFDERLGRAVALKQVRAEVSSDSQAWRRFEREARAVARLRHPGIVEIHDLFTEDDGDWIVMELVEGRALSDLIDEGSLQPDQVLDIAIRLALALASAHAEGIVHRDLKARNVMLTDDGQPKILDFGLAKELRGPAEASAASITADGQVVGTPHAMSPEQAMGRKVDLRSDLFSLGSLLYELSTGLAPFAAESAMAMLHRVCTHRPAPVHERTSAYPRAFSELVAQLLEKDPGYRPANAAEVASRLERAAQRLARGEITGLRQSGVELVAERRQLTIVECLLVVEASGQPIADPVELAAVMEIFETVARQVFEELQGYVARCEGQRLEAYFGYPRAQEDAARRAIHAAQEMASRLGMANLEAGGTEAGVTETEVTASIRAGVHSGPAIVHPKGESLPVLGRTADIADALARVADVGEILVSDTVRRLVADAYAVEDSGQSLGETAVFRIGRGHGTSSFRFASTPLLARDTEIGLLVDRAARAQEGAGQVMLIHGEAGIGKSRLLAGLKGEMEPLAMDWLLAQASPIHKASPLQPVIAMVEGLIDDGPAEESGERQSTNPLADLEEILGKEARSSSIPLLASLLGLPVTTPYVLPDVTPQKQREMTLQALVDLVKSLAKRHALALVVEDLHWADPTTLDWLGRLIEATRRSRLFVVLTFRPEFEVPWPAADHMTRLDLGRLTGGDIARLIEHLTGGKALPEEVCAQIAAKTDGVPLFVEELTKSLLESGALVEKEEAYEVEGEIENLAIPATLQDSLMARLDRLGRAKPVAQLAATIGREFNQKLLSAVSPLDEAQLSAELERLIEAELIFARGFSSRRRYLFKHALVQDAAYASLLDDQREANHAKIAHALESDFPKIVEQQPEVLASHFTEGRQPRKGVTYWRIAGQRNFRSSAVLEAKDFLQRGLDVASGLPESNELADDVLQLQLSLAEVSTNLDGMASAEARGAFSKTVEIAVRENNSLQAFWSLFGLWRSHLTQAEYGKAMENARGLKRWVSTRDTEVFARHAIGATHFFMGEHRLAQIPLLEALGLDEPNRSKAWTNEFSSEDPGIHSKHFASINAWMLGYPDQARQLTQDAVELAERTKHIYSRSFMATAVALLAQLMGKPSKTLEAAEASIILSQETGSWWWIMASIYRSWAAAMLAEPGTREAVAELRQAIDQYRSIGMQAHTAKYWIMLGEAALRHELWSDASQALDRSIDMMAQTNEGYFEAEAYRLRGNLLCVVDSGSRGSEIAEGSYDQAIQSARSRGARSLELRAALDLGRLYVGKRREAEAEDLVGGVLRHFDEGLDTPDLARAHDFLASLRGSS